MKNKMFIDCLIIEIKIKKKEFSFCFVNVCLIFLMWVLCVYKFKIMVGFRFVIILIFR